MFIPQDLNIANMALANKQHIYDTNEETGNALKDYILKTPGLTEEDKRANQIKAQEVDKSMDEIHDKYKGDLTQATSDIKNLVRKYKYDPELQARTSNYNDYMGHIKNVDEDTNLSSQYKQTYKQDLLQKYGATTKQENGSYNKIELPGYNPIVDESKKIGEFLDKAKASTKEYYDKVHGIGGYEKALTKHSKEELDYNTLMDAGAQFIVSDPELSKSFRQRSIFEKDGSYNSGLLIPTKNKNGNLEYIPNMSNPAIQMLHANASIRAYKKETLDSNLFNDQASEDAAKTKQENKIIGDAYQLPIQTNSINLKSSLDNLYDPSTQQLKPVTTWKSDLLDVLGSLSIGDINHDPKAFAKSVTDYQTTKSPEVKQRIVDEQIDKLRKQYPELNKTNPKTKFITNADGTHSDADSGFLKSLYTAMENNDATASKVFPIVNTSVVDNIRRQVVGETKDLGDGKKLNSGLANNSNLSAVGQGRLTSEQELNNIKQLGYTNKQEALANAEVVGIPGFDFTQDYQGGVQINIPSLDGATSQSYNLPPSEAVKQNFKDVDEATSAMRSGKTIEKDAIRIDRSTGKQVKVHVKYHPKYDENTGEYTCIISEYEPDGRPIPGRIRDVHSEYKKAFNLLEGHLGNQYTGK